MEGTLQAAQIRLTEDDIATIFEAAAHYLEEHGWVQGDSGRDGGPRSIDGAVRSVMGTWFEGAARDRLCYLPAAIVFRELTGESICRWNDATCRSQGQAIGRLYALASILRQLWVQERSLGQSMRRSIGPFSLGMWWERCSL
jgi:hypothetical protein